MGEYVRVALELSKMPWKDNVVEYRNWPNIKDSTPNGYLPILKEEGKEYKDQTLALCRYICIKHGMYPSDPF